MIAVVVLVLAAIVLALVRRVDVRLALLFGGAVMALAAGQPLAVFDTFARAMVAPMVAPICASMGFAAVLAATGCDRALVAVLVVPLRRCRWLLVPGGVLAGYVVNVAVPSQASTAAALGPILLPLLRASGLAVERAAAVLLVGASFGGDLLQPGAQDVQAVAGVTAVDAVALHARLWPASLAGVLAAALFGACWWRRAPRSEPTWAATNAPTNEPASEPANGAVPAAAELPPLSPRVVVQACVPLLPVVALLLAYAGAPGWQWLRSVPAGDGWQQFAGALPVVRAMLLGALLAAAVSWRPAGALGEAMFSGMGRAYGSVIALTICAQVFGAGLAATGAAATLLAACDGSSALATLSFAAPASLALVSGSGSGPILAFAETFLSPLPAGPDLDRAAALACLGGALGRTLSPVAAVVVCVAGLARVEPVRVVAGALVPLLVGALLALGVLFAGG